jgi:hypothetical protein
LLTRSTVRRSDSVSAANLQPTAPRFLSPLRLPAPRAVDASPLARRALQGQGQLIRNLQAAVGNAAVRLILQRKGGWPDASSKGRKWNDPDPKKVRPDSKIWRIAIAGLKGGTANRFKGGDSAHTTEAADHRAIVLIPVGFDPEKPADKPVEVLLYFHGHTQAWRGRYAGYRQRSFEKPTEEMKKGGLDSADDTVRDVALDQIEDQVEQSGHSRMLGILAQGGPAGEFGDINADDYIRDVLTRVNAEYPAQLKKVPSSWQVILSGHSGGGTEVNRILTSSSKPANLKAIILFDAESMDANIKQRMTDDLKFLADPDKTDADRATYLAARPPVRVFARSNEKVTLKYAQMYINLVDDTITAFTDRLLSSARQKELDALKARQACVVMPDADRRRLAELRRKKPGPGAERDELKALEEKAACKPLTARDRTRFDELAKRESQLQSVTAFLPTVRQLYQVTRIDEDTLGHEEIIRGARTGSGDYKPGQGNLEKALKSIP